MLTHSTTSSMSIHSVTSPMSIHSVTPSIPLAHSATLVRLDQNAGAPICQTCLDEWLRYINVNNLQGFSKEKRHIQSEVKQKYKELQEALGFEVVLFNTGASSAIETIFKRIPTLTFVGDHHPLVERCRTLQKERYSKDQLLDNVRMYNLVQSHNGEIGFDTGTKLPKGAVVILDVSQAIGVIDLDMVRSHAQCIFFSCHKIGGPFGTGFLACTEQFYKHYIKSVESDPENSQQLYIPKYLMNGFQGTFNLSGFMSAAMAVIQAVRDLPNRSQMYDTYKHMYNMLKTMSHIKDVQPTIKLDQALDAIPNSFGAINFKLDDKYCPMSFQSFLEDEHVQIGFKTACQSGKNGTLRVSWKRPVSKEIIQFVHDAMVTTFRRMDEKLAELTTKKEDVQNEVRSSSQNGPHEIEGGAEQSDSDPIPLEDGLKALYGGQTRKSKSYQQLNQTFLDKVNANLFWLQGHLVKSHDAPPEIDPKYGVMFQKQLLNVPKLVSLIIPPHTKAQKLEADALDSKITAEQTLTDIANGINLSKGLLIQNRRVAKLLWINWRENPKSPPRTPPYDLRLEDFQTYLVGKHEVFKWPITLPQEIKGFDEPITPFNLFVLNSLSEAAVKAIVDTNAKRHQIYVPSEKLVGRQIIYPEDPLNVLFRYNDLRAIDSHYPNIGQDVKSLPKPDSKAKSDDQGKVSQTQLVIHMLDEINVDKIRKLVTSRPEADFLIYVPFTTEEDVISSYEFLIQHEFEYESLNGDDLVYDVWYQNFIPDYTVVCFTGKGFLGKEPETKE